MTKQKGGKGGLLQSHASHAPASHAPASHAPASSDASVPSGGFSNLLSGLGMKGGDGEGEGEGEEVEVEEKEEETVMEPSVGGKKSKSEVKKGGKGKGNKWIRLVTQTYKKNKRRNKNYTFKQAIKEAKQLYKKVGGASKKDEEEK